MKGVGANVVANSSDLRSLLFVAWWNERIKSLSACRTPLWYL